MNKIQNYTCTSTGETSVKINNLISKTSRNDNFMSLLGKKNLNHIGFYVYFKKLKLTKSVTF